MVVRATGHPSLLPLPVSTSSQVLRRKHARPRPRPRPRSSRPVHHNREVFMRREKNEGWKGEIRGERRACLPSLWLSNNLLFRLWWMERQGPGSPLHAWKIGIWRQTEKYLREVLVKQPPTHNFVCSFFLALSSLSLFVSAYSFSIRCQWFRGCEFQHYINKKKLLCRITISMHLFLHKAAQCTGLQEGNESERVCVCSLPSSRPITLK